MSTHKAKKKQGVNKVLDKGQNLYRFKLDLTSGEFTKNIFKVTWSDGDRAVATCIDNPKTTFNYGLSFRVSMDIGTVRSRHSGKYVLLDKDDPETALLLISYSIFENFIKSKKETERLERWLSCAIKKYCEMERPS